MLNLNDILETINMIRQENLDIRTITMGISLLDCADSDIDVLVLMDGTGDRLTLAEEDVVRWPLYELELQSGVLISPLIMLKKNWYDRPIKSPFYHNVMREGIRL